MISNLRRFVAFILLASLLSCSTHRPGELRSIADEKELGARDIPTFLESRGGVYVNAKAQRYVAELTKKLSANAAIPAGYLPIPIKVLNTTTPSAYAVPGGSIFVSRGIIALSRTEAELAGVIAHEIGHVMARHSAKAIAANEQLVIDAINEKIDSLERETSEARQIEIIRREIATRRSEISSFSVEQELEADRLAIQILQASGYAAAGYGDLLRRLDDWQVQRAERAGITRDDLEKVEKYSGYPEVSERIAALGVFGPAQVDAETTDRLMSAIDGMSYENRFDGGIIQNNRYWHKRNQLTFDVPPQFLAEHGKSLRLVSEKGIVVLSFQWKQNAEFSGIADELRASDKGFSNVRATTINELSAIRADARTTIDGEEFIGEFVYLDLAPKIGKIATMVLLTKASDSREARSLFANMLDSLRFADAASIPKARRLMVRRLNEGESVRTLAETSVIDGEPVSALRLLNGLKTGETLQSGDWIKLVK